MYVRTLYPLTQYTCAGIWPHTAIRRDVISVSLLHTHKLLSALLTADMAMELSIAQSRDLRAPTNTMSYTLPCTKGQLNGA